MRKKNLLIILVSFLFSGSAFLFIYNVNKTANTTNPDFVKSTVATKDDPFARMEYERRMLIDPATGKIPENIRTKELKFSANLPNVETLSLAKENNVNTLTWSKRGPINRGGRTRALGIDVRTQTAPNITIIAGGASGGIYKSTDNGVTWIDKLSPDAIHSITSIAQDTRAGQENTWYVGTGEKGNNALEGGSNLFVGDGIFKSTDNGDSWTLLPSTSSGTPESFNSAFNFVFNVAVNNTTGSVFAASSNTIQRSTNGGTTWSTSRGALANNTYTDVQITTTGIIYATIPSSLTHAGISRSDDDGATWTDITPLGFPTAYGRNVIGIAPSNENIVYFWVYTAAGATGTELWKYDASGSTWTDLTGNLPTIGGNVGTLNVQGQYNMVIKIKPDDANFVLIGGTNLYRSTDGFSTQVTTAGWIGGYSTANDISQYANHHPDQHALVFLSSPNTNVLYSGSDGGVSKTTDITQSTVVWADLNTGYLTSQFYSLAIDPVTANDNTIAGGMQDNGNYLTFSNNFNTNWIDWKHGGDGGFSEVRKTGASTYTVYLEAQNGWLWRQQYVGGVLNTDNLIQPNYTGSFLFVNPFVLDLNNNNIMYFSAGDSVMRSNDVSTTATWSTLTNATTGSAVTALSVSKATANRLYVGGSNGKILKIDGANTGNPTAIDISAGLPAGAYVNCIYVDPANADNIIAVFSNYSIKSLWSSSNGGTTWVDISGNLEENANGSGSGPSCRWVTAVNVGGSSTYYVTTSTGLYSTSTLNGTSTVWAKEGSSTIGNVVCVMVRGRDADGLVAVATHGAGIFSASLVTSVEDGVSFPDNYALSQNYPNPFNPSTTIRFTIPQTSKVKLTLFDALGREVQEITNKDFSAGEHSINFNAANLTSGVYFYRIEAGSFVQSKKMILLR